MTSLFPNQMDIFYLHFIELSAILVKTDNSLFLKTLLSLDFENSPRFHLTSLAVLSQSFQTHWPLTSLYLFSEYVNHVHGTKFTR